MDAKCASIYVRGIMKKLLLIDGNSILNRAYYAMMGRNMLTTKDGIYTNAIFGFLNTYDKFIANEAPTHVAVAFDMKHPTFRHKMYDGYKAGRRPMPEELVMQMPIIKDVLDKMGIARIELKGYEADDILGTLSARAEAENIETIILTGDKDMMQLAGKECTIKIPTTSKGTTTIYDYSESSIKKEFGIEPVDFIEVKALMGDKSDNIPGVAGVGQKTALSLITQFGSLEKVYENLDSIKSLKQREKLENDKENAYLSRDLARIDRAVPIEFNFDSLKIGDMDDEGLYELFSQLEFNHYIKKYKLKRSAASSVEITRHLINDKASLVPFKNIYAYCNFNDNGQPVEFSYTADGVNVYVLEDISLIEPLMNYIKGIGGHYLKKLFLYLIKSDIRTPAVIFDTAAAAYVADALKDSYGLNELCDKYLEIDFAGDDDTACRASKIYYLSGKMEEVIKENEGGNLLFEVELPLIEVLAFMETVGFRADSEFLKKFSMRMEKELVVLEKSIFEETGEEFNVNSPKQLGEILFVKMNMPYAKKTKTGYSTSADILKKLAVKFPVAELVLEYRKLSKLKSTYADGLVKVIADDGRIHSNFRQTVAATGRLSSTEPNLQNLPVRTELGREIRKAFIPENKEFKLTSADYSQIELRILAHVSNDEDMKKAFSNNEDIHTQTAAKVFGLDDRFVTKDMRRAAKAVNFGIIYGISDYGLSEDLSIPIYTAKEYIEEYLNQYKGIKKYMEDIVDFAKKTGYVQTIFGRRRYIPELESKNYIQREFGKRVALNAPIQGTAADIIKIAMIKVYKELKKRKLKSRLILQVHDELVIETHSDEVDDIEKILEECMMGAAELSVPLEIDVHTGVSLYDTK